MSWPEDNWTRMNREALDLQRRQAAFDEHVRKHGLPKGWDHKWWDGKGPWIVLALVFAGLLGLMLFDYITHL